MGWCARQNYLEALSRPSTLPTLTFLRPEPVGNGVNVIMEGLARPYFQSVARLVSSSGYNFRITQIAQKTTKTSDAVISFRIPPTAPLKGERTSENCMQLIDFTRPAEWHLCAHEKAAHGESRARPLFRRNCQPKTLVSARSIASVI